MAQRDVLKYLQDIRAMGNDKFLAVKDIQKGLKARDFGNGVIRGVSNDLFKLASYGMIEWKGKGIWHHQKLFRAKKD